MSMSELSSVYKIDNEQWLERTIEILKEKRLEKLDLEHLIEELETLSRRNRLKREIVASEGAIIPKLIPRAQQDLMFSEYIDARQFVLTDDY